VYYAHYDTLKHTQGAHYLHSYFLLGWIQCHIHETH